MISCATPIVAMSTISRGLLNRPAKNDPLDHRGERTRRGQAAHEREPVVEMVVAGEREHHRHRERTELAVREVDRPVRHVDQHEAHREQRVGHAERETEDDDVHQRRVPTLQSG